MKVKRSSRLIDMTNYLMNRPHRLISLPFFMKRYDSAKSSISEDLTILKRTFKERGIGDVQTIPGAAGGVEFAPYMLKGNAIDFVQDMKNSLNDDERYLPGGYVYMADLLDQPNNLKHIGKIITTKYSHSSIDAVMTAATKGIPIAQSVASYLNVPFVVAQHDSKITEGSTISVNYVSGSSDRIRKMVLSKRSLEDNSNVLIVDDYLKGGGTMGGMKALLREFNCHLVGAAVFAEENYKREPFSNDQCVSLVKVSVQNNQIKVVDGNYLQTIYGDE